ncbi:methyl-accepting chemotaxis protein [Paenibacillus sp. B01]|uniref:methyl-accepting chemotaxis protein n=1 Tax=Paenibacillus sp. B01 TaxID=2660554 RepID=UPI001E590C5A|nr:methyl-accepting chemotaxis protein [Paenibacillus sp. B01]
MQNPFQRRMRKSGGGTSTEPSLSDKPSGAKADARARLRNPLHLLSVRLFLIVFVSIVACVAVVGTLSFQISKGVIEKKVTAASNETIDQIRGKLDLILGNYENFSIQFITDKSLQDNIRELGSSASDEYAIFENQRALSTKLSAMAMSNAEVMNVNYIPLQEKYGTNVLGTGNLKYETVKDAPWLKQAVELGGKSIWIPIQEKGFQGNDQRSFGLARTIRDTSGSYAYALLIELKASLLEQQLQNVKIGEGSRIRILDVDNTILIDNIESGLAGEKSVIDFAGSGASADSGSFITESNVGQVLAVYQTLETVGWKVLGMIPTSELVRDAKEIERMTWLIAAAAALIAILVGVYVVASVGRPLQKLRNLMGEAKDGNLAVRSDIRSQNEIGQLSESFNDMMGQITALVGQTRDNAQHVLHTASEVGEASRRTAGAAREIAVATEEIAGGATSLAMEAERGSDLAGGMDQNMRQVKAMSDEMRLSAEQVDQASRQGTEHMAAMIQKTGETEQMVRDMTEKVGRLQESTSSIRKILEMLGGVAKQTNILSLNASIEAARAGEAGKGFMVVAGEIRQLAEQSRQSIGMVESITTTIQTEIEETVEALGKAQPVFQEQIGSVKEANGIFHEVQARMNSLASTLENVAESIRLLDESQQQIGSAMGSVSAVAEQSSATSQEVASLSSEQLGVSESLVGLAGQLEQVSQSLQRSLDRFKA